MAIIRRISQPEPGQEVVLANVSEPKIPEVDFSTSFLKALRGMPKPNSMHRRTKLLNTWVFTAENLRYLILGIPVSLSPVYRPHPKLSDTVEVVGVLLSAYVYGTSFQVLRMTDRSVREMLDDIAVFMTNVASRFKPCPVQLGKVGDRIK